MATIFNKNAIRSNLCQIASDFHQRGWMPGTAGNLSARSVDHPHTFWITASSLPKGQLEQYDFLQLEIESGEVIQRFRDSAKPSAETSIHQVIYRLYPEAGACFHVHSVDACLASAAIAAGQKEMALPPLEVIKGLGIWEQNPEVAMPLFDNILEVPKIAAEIEQRFSQQRPQIDALMIRDHGVTVWGDSLQQAYDRLEIVEFIMSYMARST